MGIFFISIGASLDFTLVTDRWLAILLITTSLMLSKWLILLLVAKIFKLDTVDRPFFAMALAQGGEFAFVLFQFAKTNGVLPADTTALLISAVAISMFLTPFLFILYDKISSPTVASAQNQASDPIVSNNSKVILAGFGRFGTDVGRFLLSAGIKPVILDHDAGNVRVLRKFGYEVYYGDATRLDLLEAAGIASAQLLIIAMGDKAQSKQIVELVKKHYPKVAIIARVSDREAAFEMIDLGVADVHRESFGSSLHLAPSGDEKFRHEARSHRTTSAAV